MTIESLPEWLGGGLLAAGVAAMGFVAKQVFDVWSARMRQEAKRKARLLELGSLLRASRALFETQRVHNVRLAKAIEQKLPELAVEGSGFDRLFSRAFPQLAGDDRDLHAVIRSITEHGMRTVNLALAKWLRRDVDFKVGHAPEQDWRDLASRLNQLEAHLLIWHAKFEAWIPGHPEHALVYLADEEAHGIAFPAGLDDVVARLAR